jgi:hypothetical protein
MEKDDGPGMFTDGLDDLDGGDGSWQRHLFLLDDDWRWSGLSWTV